VADRPNTSHLIAKLQKAHLALLLGQGCCGLAVWLQLGESELGVRDRVGGQRGVCVAESF
jgi:hypothetical protein